MFTFSDVSSSCSIGVAVEGLAAGPRIRSSSSLRILTGWSATGILHAIVGIGGDGLCRGRLSYQEIGELCPDGLIRTSLILLYCFEGGEDVLKDGVRGDELLLHAKAQFIDLGDCARFICLHVRSIMFTHNEGRHPLPTLLKHL